MKINKIFFSALACTFLWACGTTSTVPITGRKHTLLVNDAEVLSLSKTQYSQVLQQSTLSKDAAKTAMVKRVGTRLASAVETYLKNNGMSSDLQYYEWEFNLVKSTDVNAFCMPGGKIVVYEGILPVTQDEASLAIVLGHEIAHAVAKHSAEQMSKVKRQQTGTSIATSILSGVVGSNAASLAGTLASAGFNFANLKYSRDNELEADHIGLVFAAMAGYDPQVALPFWKRMASQSTSQKSELTSDHPSDATRIAALEKEIPEAMKYYTAATGTTTSSTTKKTTKSIKLSSLTGSKNKTK